MAVKLHRCSSLWAKAQGHPCWRVQSALDDGDPGDAALTALCERAIRNHDPCISCSTHFLDLTVERTP